MRRCLIRRGSQMLLCRISESLLGAEPRSCPRPRRLRRAPHILIQLNNKFGKNAMLRNSGQPFLSWPLSLVATEEIVILHSAYKHHTQGILALKTLQYHTCRVHKQRLAFRKRSNNADWTDTECVDNLAFYHR
nr:MAG TPA_asm: hypothetical protein [Caudoviricetes sp.]